MAYNTKAIKTDLNAKPIPQLYNPVTDEYEVLQGVGGAARQVLYGPDGQPISTTDNKLAVRAAELEAKIEAVRVLLNTLAGEDFATQTTLAQILAKMIASPATEAKQDTLNTKVATDAEIKILQSKVDALSTKIDTLKNGEDNYVDAQLKGSLVAVGGKNYPVSGGNTLRGLAADKPTATAAHAAIPYCYYLSIDTNVIEVTDGTSWVVF